MKTKTAIALAMKNPEFAAHAIQVANAIEQSKASSCMYYAIGGETFYYGFDGVDMQSGKHSASTARKLLAEERALIIQ